MPDSLHRERERAYAQACLAAVCETPEHAFSIHYALQRLRRNALADAPPVAAIAAYNIGTGKEHVFSIKSAADSAGIDLSKQPQPAQMATLEYNLLFAFNDFLASHRDRLFIHWYMRDERFGFAALEQRYRAALSSISATLYGPRSAPAAAPFGFAPKPSQFPVRIDDDHRIDLALALRQLFGIGPVGLRDLAQANGLSLADMIEGINEPSAFAVGNHAHLSWSSMSKARIIARLTQLAHRGAIKPVRNAEELPRGKGLRIFINYRREDTEAAANWLHDLLSLEFGERNVFIDTDDIPAGIDFEEFLRKQIDGCDVFLALIGRGWAAVQDGQGHARITGEHDFVRSEIRAALARGIPVIPVLVEGTSMPTELVLPADIMPLRRRQAVELRSREFRQDVAQLVAKIREAHQVGLHKAHWYGGAA